MDARFDLFPPYTKLTSSRFDTREPLGSGSRRLLIDSHSEQAAVVDAAAASRVAVEVLVADAVADSVVDAVAHPAAVDVVARVSFPAALPLLRVY